VKFDDPGKLTVKGRLGFLGRDTAIYGGAAAFSKAFGLITFPLLARNFSVAEYGILDFFLSITTLIAVGMIFGQDSAVARYFYEYEESSQREQVITEWLLFQLLLLLFLIPVLWLFSTQIASELSDAEEAETLLKLMILQVPSLLLINFSQNILKWSFSRTRFLIISVGSTIFSALALVVGIVIYGLGRSLSCHVRQGRSWCRCLTARSGFYGPCVKKIL